MATRMNTVIKTIDEYIAQFPEEVQVLLEKMRTIIHKAAPKAEEAITYGISTFKTNGNLVHFGGYKSQIGFYPAPSGIGAFKKELAKYEGSKGTIRFPLDKPLPVTLITQVIKFRVAKNLEKSKQK